jgi:hypothetical protein
MSTVTRYLAPGSVDALLTVALGTHWVRHESRFRNLRTGEIKDRLDLRGDDVREWATEERAIIETEWS